jgi:hypothetical protein
MQAALYEGLLPKTKYCEVEQKDPNSPTKISPPNASYFQNNDSTSDKVQEMLNPPPSFPHTTRTYAKGLNLMDIWPS